MSIIETLIAITLLYTVLVLAMVVLVLSLTWIFKTWAWYALAAGLTISGGIRVLGLVRLPSQIIEAQSRGVMPSSISFDQWLITIATLLGVTLMVTGFGKLRMDLRKVNEALKRMVGVKTLTEIKDEETDKLK